MVDACRWAGPGRGACHVPPGDIVGAVPETDRVTDEYVETEQFRGARIHLCDLAGLEIRDCEVSGLKIVDC